jgi:hypothetical protein
MSKDPLVIYNIVLDNGEEFNIHQASTSFLEDLARSRYIGAVSSPAIFVEFILTEYLPA